jgi:hypothetical protein
MANKLGLRQCFSATKAQSHKEKPWCLSDFVATLKFLYIKITDKNKISKEPENNRIANDGGAGTTD